MAPVGEMDQSRRKLWTARAIKWLVVLLILMSGIVPYQNFNALVLIGLCALIGGWGYWHPVFLPMVLFIVWTLVSAVIGFGEGQRWSSSDFLFVYLFVPLFVLPAINWDANDVSKIFYTLFAVFVFMTLVAIMQSLFGIDKNRRPLFIAFSEFHAHGYIDNYRMPGVWNNAMRYPFAITIISTALLFYFKQGNKLIGPTRPMVLLLTAVNLWLSKSRAAIASMVLILPFVFIRKFSGKALISGVCLGLVGLLLVFLVVSQNATFRKRMERVLTKENGRVQVWQDSYRLFKERPWVGHGGRKRVVVAYNELPDDEKSQYFTEKGTAAHNNFIAIACSYGVIGLILWTWFMIVLLVHAYRQGYRLAFSLLILYQLLGLLYHISEARALSAVLFLLVGLDMALGRQGLLKYVRSEDGEFRSEFTGD